MNTMPSKLIEELMNEMFIKAMPRNPEFIRCTDQVIEMIDGAIENDPRKVKISFGKIRLELK